PRGPALGRHAQGDAGDGGGRHGGGRGHDAGHLRVRTAGHRRGRAGARILPSHRHPPQVLGAARAGRDPPRSGGLRSEPPGGGAMMALAIAGLIFLAIIVLVVGLWWVAQAERTVRARLKRPGPAGGPTGILRSDVDRIDGTLGDRLGATGLMKRLNDLVTQSAYKGTSGDLALIIMAFAVIGGAGAWLRTGAFLWGLIAGIGFGSLPIVYLLYRRRRRLTAFQSQFPDSLDTITRAIRAGNALSGAIRVVGEDMPDPVGAEFRRVDEEIRLGMDPGEALFRLQTRVPVEDISFFCTAIRIQR